MQCGEIMEEINKEKNQSRIEIVTELMTQRNSACQKYEVEIATLLGSTVVNAILDALQIEPDDLIWLSSNIIDDFFAVSIMVRYSIDNKSDFLVDYVEKDGDNIQYSKMHMGIPLEYLDYHSSDIVQYLNDLRISAKQSDLNSQTFDQQQLTEEQQNQLKWFSTIQTDNYKQ